METEFEIPESWPRYIDSDPTYEAWKPHSISSSALREKYSDPTYEAWKLLIALWVYPFFKSTPILPMRHGNDYSIAIKRLVLLKLRSYL